MKSNLLYDFDVAIIGAGIAGICAAYELSMRSNLRVVLIDKGNKISARACPIKGTTSKCKGCNECSIMNGFGGAGGFSDGKYNITTQFGGWLTDYVSDEEAINLINYVDEINMKFGATKDFFSTETKEAKEIEREALKYDLHLLQAKVKHLGTENNFNILCKMYEYLQDKVTILCNTDVREINKKEDGSYEIDYIPSVGRPLDTSIMSVRYIIAAPGRSGAEWFSNVCKNTLGIELVNNQIDLGVRVELPNLVFSHITDSVYEAKIKYVTSRGNTVRTFCMNPSGYVVYENTDGTITVNGHSYADKSLGSDNTNFAILVSTTFTEPFKDPYQYGKRTASFSNLLGNGIIVQRYGDLKAGRRTNEKRLKESFTRPTLASATPGDLGYVIQYNQLTDIIEMIERLDKIAPGTANNDTLLYGVEVKYYSARPKELSPYLETTSPNLFAIGDGAGITRGLSQAGASGILAARGILEKIK